MRYIAGNTGLQPISKPKKPTRSSKTKKTDKPSKVASPKNETHVEIKPAIVDKFNTQRIGAVTLRGREKPIQVYEVLP